MKNDQLSREIEKKRAELIDIVKKEGLNSPLAIQYSQELDGLLNHYNRLLLKQYKSNYSKNILSTSL